MTDCVGFWDILIVLDVRTLAKVLSVSLNTAYSLVRSGQIRSVRVGRGYRVPREALFDYLEKST